MLRDERIRAVDDLPVTLDIRRPNGSLFRRIVPDERQAGGAVTEIELADTAPLGAWSVEARVDRDGRSEEHTSELQSLMRISYAVFGLKKKKETSTTRQSNAVND